VLTGTYTKQKQKRKGKEKKNKSLLETKFRGGAGGKKLNRCRKTQRMHQKYSDRRAQQSGENPTKGEGAEVNEIFDRELSGQWKIKMRVLDMCKVETRL